MTTITHRELRNNSADILRRVAAGEAMEVTNRGVVVAHLSPAATPVLPFTTVVDGVALTPLTRDQFREAGLYPQVGLRSLDALHLAGALGIDAAAILTYDTGLAEAARAHGLEVVAPE